MASIDGAVSHQDEKKIRRQSLQNLQTLRDEFRRLSGELEQTSSDPSVYLGSLFDLLGGLDVLAQGAKLNLKRLEDHIPQISKIVDEISEREGAFRSGSPRRIGNFRSSLETQLAEQFGGIQYEDVARLNIPTTLRGDPKGLFRWMVDAAQDCSLALFGRYIAGKVFPMLSAFVHSHLLLAYREYVRRQDEFIISEMEKLSDTTGTPISPLSTTVEQTAREFLAISMSPGMHLGASNMFERFIAWFFRQRCEFNSSRGQQVGAIRKEIQDNVEAAIEIFLSIYICEDEKLKQSYLCHICTGGEKTFWSHIQDHIQKLDELLENQVRISKWKFGLYQNRSFFVSKSPDYKRTINELLGKKEDAEKLIVDLV